MRKFAAHYLLSDTGVLLKKGIAVVGDDGFIVQVIDTTGDLKELEQMIFHSGLLIGAYDLVKDHPSAVSPTHVDTFNLQVRHSAADLNHISFKQLTELAQQLQQQFPAMDIPALLDKIPGVLISESGYVKVPRPGIYLLTGIDLENLHFTPKSRLKKIL
jgi:hypothetical protein